MKSTPRACHNNSTVGTTTAPSAHEQHRRHNNSARLDVDGHVRHGLTRVEEHRRADLLLWCRSAVVVTLLLGRKGSPHTHLSRRFHNLSDGRDTPQHI